MADVLPPGSSKSRLCAFSGVCVLCACVCALPEADVGCLLPSLSTLFFEPGALSQLNWLASKILGGSVSAQPAPRFKVTGVCPHMWLLHGARVLNSGLHAASASRTEPTLQPLVILEKFSPPCTHLTSTANLKLCRDDNLHSLMRKLALLEGRAGSGHRPG